MLRKDGSVLWLAPRMIAVVSVCLLLAIVCAMPAVSEEPNYMALGDKAYKEADYSGAITNYTKFLDERLAINDTPGRRVANCYAMMQLGKCWRALKEFGEARKCYERIVQTFPQERRSCAEAQYELGLVIMKTGNRKEALASLEKVLTDYPEERGHGVYALLKMAKIQNGHRTYDSAATYLRKILTDYSDKKVVCREAGIMLVDVLDNLNETSQAVSAAKSLLTSDALSIGEKVEVLTKAVNMECGLGKPDAALETLNQFVTTNVDQLQECWEVVMLRAQILFKQNDYAKAATEYQRLLSTYERYLSDRPHVRRQLAMSLKLAGRNDEALAAYGGILGDRRSTKDDIIRAIDARAELLRGEGKTSAADAERDRAKTELASIVSDAEASKDRDRLIEIAMAQIELGDKTGARATFDAVAALTQQDGNPEAQAFMDVEYSCHLRDYARVIEDAKATLAAFPGGPHEIDLLFFLAQGYDFTGDMGKALETYGQVLSKCRSAYGSRARELACCSLMHMGIRLAEAGKKAEAIAKYEQAVNDYPSIPQSKMCATLLGLLKGE